MRGLDVWVYVWEYESGYLQDKFPLLLRYNSTSHIFKK